MYNHNRVALLKQVLVVAIAQRVLLMKRSADPTPPAKARPPPAKVGSMIKRLLARVDAGKDGKAGKDGNDGKEFSKASRQFLKASSKSGAAPTPPWELKRGAASSSSAATPLLPMPPTKLPEYSAKFCIECFGRSMVPKANSADQLCKLCDTITAVYGKVNAGFIKTDEQALDALTAAGRLKNVVDGSV